VKSRSIFGFDFLLLAASIFLIIIGIFFIFSSGVTATGVVFSNEYIKQTVWAVTGLGLLSFFAFTDYSRIRNWSLGLYVGSVIILFLTLFFGKVVNGARSWIGIWELGIQPAEFCKIIVILFLAHVLDKFGAQVRNIFYYLASFGILVIPMFLILLQPDLGTSTVFIPIFFFMMFAAGADVKHLLFFFLTGILLIIFAAIPAYEIYIAGRSIPAFGLVTDRQLAAFFVMALFIVFLLSAIGYFISKRKYLYWISYFSLILFFAVVGSIAFRKVLKEYQIMRLIVFLNPSIDPRGAGWNIIQSITAVGSGGIWGKGFLRGTQSHYRYIPQQSTDFIFSILSEEWGFVGCLLVFGLFLIILIRGLYIMISAKDRFAGIAASGIIGMIFFHFVVNVGMAIGIMPITGIPLFFISYGGSALWTVLIGIGLLMSFYMRRYRY
jgi:rod shape determining protein RodA